MIRETLSAIGLASRRALTARFGRQDWSTNLAHVREWSFAMPHLARVTVANSPVHQVYVGFSRNLMQKLGKDSAARQIALDEFMEQLKDNLLANVPARRPIVRWEMLEPSADPRFLRGVRSFILRHHSEVGNLYLMSDLASRQEFECLRDPEWSEQVADQLLPGDLGRVEVIENPRMLDRLSTYLTRCEQDVELFIPGADGEIHAANGVVLRRKNTENGHLLELSLDLDRRLGLDLTPGMEVEGAFGAAGRVFRFRTTCHGKVGVPLDGLGQLSCVSMVLPSRFNLDQRRRYFRVEPANPLQAHIKVLSPTSGQDQEPVVDAPVVGAEVADLSFSGAGLTFEASSVDGLELEARVEVTFTGADLSDPVVITGLVRRHSVQPRGRGKQSTQLGIEFVIVGNDDRQATQRIRQYVMERQRALLTSRGRDEVGATP